MKLVLKDTGFALNETKGEEVGPELDSLKPCAIYAYTQLVSDE